MAADFSFQETLEIFKKNISKNLSTENLGSFAATFKAAAGTDADKRTASDQALRNLISSLICETIDKKRSDPATARDALKVISASVLAAKQSMCSASLPFILLGDVLDCLTLDNCDPVFCYIEERVATWKSPQFYTAGKNYLLRMCNDLLRRLSQAQNTVFCGRIQLFLARLFPLSEKSALNLVSQFNSDNVTIFNEDSSESILKKKSSSKIPKEVTDKSDHVEIKPQKDELWLDGGLEGMEVDQSDISVSPAEKTPKVDDKGLIVDYELYHNIWSLQDTFRSPVQCYTKEKWDKFLLNADSVFRVFSSFKLDKQHFSEQQQNKAYFAKFLTSEKLTNLQLNDSMFRRQILCQFLILFQYLSGTVKFKSVNAVLLDKQKEWIESSRKKIFSLLEETPPDGKHFVKFIEHLLAREEFWIQWKNEGCTSFIKTNNKEDDKEEAAKTLSSPPAKKRKMADSSAPKWSTIGQDFVSGKPLGMGSPELTRLWELCPDNLEACKSEKRRFLPTLKGFFSDGIELMNPKNMVEEEYMPYNDQNFQWKALRLLSQRSPLFFASQPATMQFKVVPQYLKGAMEKLSKEFPQNTEQPELIQVNGEIDKSSEEEESSMQQEEKSRGDQEYNEVDENDVDEDDDEVLEDDDLDNDDALLNDDSQQEGDDVDSDDDGLLEAVSVGDSLSSNDVTIVAQKIGADWLKLAPFLDLNPRDIEDIKEDSEDVILQARQTLVTWQDRKRSEARKPALIQALTLANMEDIAKEIS